MFQIKQPLFNLDGSGGAAIDTGSSDWGSFIQNEIASQIEPANEDQPLTESDAEGLEGEKAEGQDVVEPNPDEAKPEEEKPVESLFNDETEVDLGEGRQPVKLAELKQGYLRQSDYTKKTQALADERKSFETERTELEPVRGLNQFLAQNPFLAQQINGFIRDFQTTGNISLDEALSDAQYGQYINHLLYQVNTLKQEKDDLQSKYGELEFGSTMSQVVADLKGEYGDLITPEYEQELRDQAKTDGLKPEVIKKMAKGDLAEKKLAQTEQDKTKITKETEAKTIQTLQEQRKALPPQPKASGQRPTDDAPDFANMDWLEIAKHAAGKR